MISSSVADGVAHGGDHGDVLAPVGVVEAELDGADAPLAKRETALDALLRLEQLAARGVGEEPLASGRRGASRAATSSALPTSVPDRDLDRPRPAAVQVDRLADLADDLRPQRVDADEQTLEQLPVGQSVAARRDARDALVRVHEHDGRLLRGPRHRIPGGAERRVERVDGRAASRRR